MLRIIPPSKKLPNISIQVPGSKSYTNRALLLAALAKGKSTLIDPLESEDTLVMKKGLKQLGVRITSSKNKIIIHGSNGKFTQSAQPLFLENAGTAVRSLTAALATQPFESTLSGNKRMQERPLKDLINALKKAQIKIESKTGCPPVTLHGPLPGGLTSIKGDVSSQYISALLMAGPLAQETFTINITGKLTSRPYVDMTLDIMNQFGVAVSEKKDRFTIHPQKYRGRTYHIEGDASSATYPLALAALHRNKVIIKNINKTSKQADIQFLDVLEKMGCRISKTTKSISVQGPKQLTPLRTINLNKLPDAAMTVAILCAFAKGKSKLTGLANLRVKETDRLKALATELTKIGTRVEEGKDFLTIHGDPENLHGAIIETYNDHRMAMCFAVVGSKISNIHILNPNCVQKTYPTFWKELSRWGINTKKINSRTHSNIVLAGLRGSGKSSVGKAIAKQLKYDFIDTDEYIVKKHKMTIPGIVAKKGWPYFRQLEAQAAKDLSKKTKTVISTGGGMFIQPQNIEDFKKTGIIIFLQATPAILAKRIHGDSNRPALTNQTSTQKELEQLWKERKQNYYQAADIVMDISPQSTSFKKDINAKSKAILQTLALGV